MFKKKVTAEHFEKWVKEIIGVKEPIGLWSWMFSNRTIREEIIQNEKRIEKLEQRMQELTAKLELEYKTIPSKTGYYKKKKG